MDETKKKPGNMEDRAERILIHLGPLSTNLWTFLGNQKRMIRDGLKGRVGTIGKDSKKHGNGTQR